MFPLFFFFFSTTWIMALPIRETFNADRNFPVRLEQNVSFNLQNHKLQNA